MPHRRTLAIVCLAMALLLMMGIWAYRSGATKLYDPNAMQTDSAAFLDDTKKPTPYIGYLSPSRGLVGTNVAVRGNNLTGFEGDILFIFTRGDGKTIEIRGGAVAQAPGDTSGAQATSFTLDQPCQQGQTVYGEYSGKPSLCDYVELTPGIYDVYTKPWGVESNHVTFTVTAK